MSLPTPTLDDRRFQDLVDDAKRLVMRRCPEWTDHNLADPGVTLIETFAYMTDQLLYRLNRVPDRLFVRFLDLIGLRMLAPTAARAPVTFWLTAAVEEPITIPAGTQVSTFRSEAEEPLIFTTTESLTLSQVSLTRLVTRAVSDPEPFDATSKLEVGAPVQPFSTVPEPGDCLLVGLSAAAPGAAVRLDFNGSTEGVGVNPKRPPLIWQAWGPSGWEVCETEQDGTGGLNRTGSLIVHVPAGHENSVICGQARGWLRARVVEPEEGQPPYSASPVVRELTASVVGGSVTAVHAEIIELEAVGEAEGVAGGKFTLARTPILTGLDRPILEVSSAAGWQEWQQVEDFTESAETDRHFVLDAHSGELAFGPLVRAPDGTVRQYGAVPDKGESVRIRRYAVGGGAAGNVSAGSIQALRSSIPFVSGVTNRHPAQGGVDGETLEEAKIRGPLLLRTRNRAVAAEDYELLARQAAPEIARVRAVSADGSLVAAGTVKVLVVPAAPAEDGRVRLDDLIPAEDTLTRIAARLEEARVLGTRIHLEPPFYRGITVVARLLALPSVNVSRVREDALTALYQLLNPLPGGGPDGDGWPFGRPVQQGELFAVLQRIRGVELVEEARLFGADPITGKRGTEAKRIELDRNSLVFSFEHQVRVETPL